MTAAVLVLEVAFVSITLVGRMALQWRRTGDTGFRLSSSLPAAARLSSGLMIFGSAAWIGAPALALLGWSDHDDVVPSAIRVLGLAVVVNSFALATWSQLAMGRSWRIGVDEAERTDLIIAGPFRVVRNPIFSAMALASIGVALVVPTVVALVGAIAVIVGIETQARFVEEPYLLRTHGRAYGRYTEDVGRFVPAVGRFGRSPDGNVSS